LTGSNQDFASYVTRTLLKELSAEPPAKVSAGKLKSPQKPKPEKKETSAVEKKPEKKAESEKKTKKKLPKSDWSNGGDHFEEVYVPDEHDFANYVTRRLVKNLSGSDTPKKDAAKGRVDETKRDGAKKAETDVPQKSGAGKTKQKEKKLMTEDETKLAKTKASKKSDLADPVAKKASKPSAGTEDKPKKKGSRPEVVSDEEDRMLSDKRKHEDTDSDTDKYALKAMAKKVAKKRPQKPAEDTDSEDAILKRPPKLKKKAAKKEKVSTEQVTIFSIFTSAEKFSDKLLFATYIFMKKSSEYEQINVPNQKDFQNIAR
jgi:hypothetical protein